MKGVSTFTCNQSKPFLSFQPRKHTCKTKTENQMTTEKIKWV